MKPSPQNEAPIDAAARRAVKPVICYPLKIEIYRPDHKVLGEWFSLNPFGYSSSHGIC